MLRYRVNEFAVTFDVIPRGPLLIVMGEQASSPEHVLSPGKPFADGVEEALELLQHRPRPEKEEEGGVDNHFVQTDRNGQREPFLPGSSLKGVLRSRAEKLARTMGQGCCDPFETIDAVTDGAAVSCSARVEQRRKALADEEEQLLGPEIYRMACSVCKLFGCLGLASRLQIADAYLVEGSFKTAHRDGVGIDRQRGAAREKLKFQNEVLEAGRFRTHLRVRNFELWQLGMIAYLLDDLIHSRIRLGQGKHRGLGKVSAQIQNVQITHFGARALHAHPDRLLVSGAGTLAASQGIPDIAAYGFRSCEGVFVQGVQGARDGLRYRWTFPCRQQEALWAAVAPLWQNYHAPAQSREERRPT